VNLSARRVKTSILNGHGKFVNKNNSGDREAVSQNKEGPGPRPPKSQIIQNDVNRTKRIPAGFQKGFQQDSKKDS